MKALTLPNEDFEDSLVEVCAKNVKADYIISRDEMFAKIATEVKIIKPDEFISMFK
ncbi:MAG: PIN domain-containing protein [Ruminococcaceae bacterium]|nr:PIN domain-containing protein [Oscillospiraceae bacterium]